MYRTNNWSKCSNKFLTLRWTTATPGKPFFKKTPIPKQIQIRSASSSGKPSGSTNVYLGASAAIVGSLGVGTAVYAKYDDNARRNIEDTVPFTKPLFTALYGELSTKQLLEPVEKDLSIPFQPLIEPLPDLEEKTFAPLYSDELKPGSRQPLKEDTMLVLNTLDTPTASAIDLELSKTPSQQEPDSMVTSEESAQPNHVKDEAEQKAVPENDRLNILDESLNLTTDEPSVVNEEKVQSEISTETPLTVEEIKTLSDVLNQTALEVVLEASAENLLTFSENATSTQKQAAASIREYYTKLAETVFVTKDDERYESLWQTLAELESKSQEVIDQAKIKASELQAELVSLKELIDSVRKSGASKVADKSVELMETCGDKINIADSDVEKAESELEFVLNFQQVAVNAPEILKEQLIKFVPDLVKLLPTMSALGLEKLPTKDAILAMVLQRTPQIDSEKGANPEHIQELEKEKILQDVEERLSLELKKFAQEKQIEQDHMMKELEEKYDQDILSQLKRQASAHNAHLTEELENLSHTLAVKHQQQMQGKLSECKSIYEFELAKKVSQIRAVQSKISEISDLELRQRRFQELWIAVQALNGALEQSMFHGRTRTLMPEMMSIMQLGGNNETLQEIVETVPAASAMFGVIPEKELLQRFKQVKKVCKQVALIDERGGGMGTYLLSYIKSLFVYSGWYQRNVYDQIDMENIGAYEILAKAEYFVNEGDLEQAAKFMSQLKGAARKMSSDWLNEARLLLETKQTAQLLLAYAASLSVGVE